MNAISIKSFFLKPLLSLFTICWLSVSSTGVSTAQVVYQFPTFSNIGGACGTFTFTPQFKITALNVTAFYGSSFTYNLTFERSAVVTGTPSNTTLYTAQYTFYSTLGGSPTNTIGSTVTNATNVFTTPTGSFLGTISGVSAVGTYTNTAILNGLGFTSAKFEYNGPCVPSQSPTVSSTSSPLPIIIERFSATPDKSFVGISWNTLDQEGLAYFDIQKSNDGNTWLRFMSVPKDNSNTNYEVVDSNPRIGKNWYRLNMVSVDNKSSYTNPVVAFVTVGKKTISMFPNPAFENFYLDGLSGIGSIELVDGLGRVILNAPIVSNRQQLSLAGIEAGNYRVIVSNDNGIIFQNNMVIVK